jgi:hypothetical protein
MAAKPLKKALDLSEKLIHGVKEGQSEDAPIDIPSTHKQRDPDDPEHVTDLRSGQKERKGNAPETIRDLPPDQR